MTGCQIKATIAKVTQLHNISIEIRPKTVKVVVGRIVPHQRLKANQEQGRAR